MGAKRKLKRTAEKGTGEENYQGIKATFEILSCWQAVGRI